MHEPKLINPDNHVEPDDFACANCRWWRTPAGEVRPEVGACYGAPPGVLIVGVFEDGSPDMANVRPATRRGDYCGAFKNRKESTRVQS